MHLQIPTIFGLQAFKPCLVESISEQEQEGQNSGNMDEAFCIFSVWWDCWRGQKDPIAQLCSAWLFLWRTVWVTLDLGTSPVCLPGILQAFSHFSSTSSAGAVLFLLCSLHGRSCLRGSVGVIATFVVMYKFWSRNTTQNSSTLLLFPRNTTSTRLTLRCLCGTEGMKAYCRAGMLTASNTGS